MLHLVWLEGREQETSQAGWQGQAWPLLCSRTKSATGDCPEDALGTVDDTSFEVCDISGSRACFTAVQKRRRRSRHCSIKSDFMIADWRLKESK